MDSIEIGTAVKIKISEQERDELGDVDEIIYYITKIDNSKFSATSKVVLITASDLSIDDIILVSLSEELNYYKECIEDLKSQIETTSYTYLIDDFEKQISEYNQILRMIKIKNIINA